MHILYIYYMCTYIDVGYIIYINVHTLYVWTYGHKCVVSVFGKTKQTMYCVSAQEELHPGALAEAIDGFMSSLAVHSHGTNMGLERLLALIRSATPTTKGRKPRASKVIVRGSLTQSLRKHTGYGLLDKRGHAKRADLISSGVQVNCYKAQRRKAQTRGTPR